MITCIQAKCKQQKSIDRKQYNSQKYENMQINEGVNKSKVQTANKRPAKLL